MWYIQTIKPMMPFRYLVSGGVSMRSFMPGWSFSFWRGLENMLRRNGQHGNVYLCSVAKAIK
jgi:hypothetical protein